MPSMEADAAQRSRSRPKPGMVLLELLRGRRAAAITASATIRCSGCRTWAARALSFPRTRRTRFPTGATRRGRWPTKSREFWPKEL